MGIRYGFNYHTDENISNLAMMIIKYCQQGMKYNERK